MGWIIVRNWDRFQHYDPAKRTPPWIKMYVALLHDDDFQSLTPSDRSALVGLWMLYAMTRRRVRDDTAKVSRAIGQRVTKGTLERLNRAGFIDISASAPLANISPDVDVEVDNPLSLTDNPVENPRALGTNPRALAKLDAPRRRALAWIRNGAADHIPDERLERVIADEFHIGDCELVTELAAVVRAKTRQR